MGDFNFGIPEEASPNPNYGFRRGYVKNFSVENLTDTLEGLLEELNALKREGYEPVDIRLETNYETKVHRVVVIVENREMFLR